MPSGSITTLPLAFVISKITSPITRQLKKKQDRLGDEWFLDEVFIKLNEKVNYLWRAVDQDGCELDVFVSKRGNKKAALKLFRKLFKTQPRKPSVIISTYRLLRERSFDSWAQTSCAKNFFGC
jgi:transposase-like protein